jgi:menaquinone-dependent protoporphyrinogen oxidase
MLTLLIVHGSTEGQTRKIAHHMARIARAARHYVRELDSTAVPSGFRVSEYDAVIVGASVHQGKHQSSVVAFVRDSLPALQRLPTAFFSVSLESALAGEQHQDNARRYISEFSAETRWCPGMSQSIAGALAFTNHEYLRHLGAILISRCRTQRIMSETDHEYTDWDAVQRFVNDFLRGAERTLGLEDKDYRAGRKMCEGRANGVMIDAPGAPQLGAGHT